MTGMYQKSRRKYIGVALRTFKDGRCVVNNTYYPAIVLTTLEMNGLFMAMNITRSHLIRAIHLTVKLRLRGLFSQSQNIKPLRNSQRACCFYIQY